MMHINSQLKIAALNGSSLNTEMATVNCLEYLAKLNCEKSKCQALSFVI